MTDVIASNVPFVNCPYIVSLYFIQEQTFGNFFFFNVSCSVTPVGESNVNREKSQVQITKEKPTQN